MNEQFDNGNYFEYTSAANPHMPPIAAQVMHPNINFKSTNIASIDLSKQISTPYRATTPNCLVNFVHILANESIKCKSTATSNLFAVISGSGTAKTVNGEIRWNTHDVFVIPHDESIELTADSEAILYWVHDEPVLNYLGAVPQKPIFKPIIFSSEKIKEFTQKFNAEPGAEKRNRNGVLLGNPDCPLTKTITPTLWSLFDAIEPHSKQLPHRHNSVALDLSLYAKPGVYTLMGAELNEDGSIKNPQRFDWGNGVAFITPPGWWHAHYNESDEPAVVLPIQDAGLQTYMRTLFIQFSTK